MASKKKKKNNIIASVAQLWPREIFYIKNGKKYSDDVKELFSKKSGIYILYRDDKPYYIGQTENLFKRLKNHAININAKHYNFWNRFTAFEVRSEFLNDIEAILIKSIPLADNDKNPKIDRIKIPKIIAKEIKSKLLPWQRT